MSYQLRLIQDKPIAAWTLDSSIGPYIDIAGNGYNGENVGSGSVLSHASLVQGSGKSAIIRSGEGLRFASPIYTNSRRQKPFSLEAWVKAIHVTNSIQILSHSGLYDGLSMDDDFFYFTLMFAVEPDAVVSWARPSIESSHHIVGVFDGKSIMLYVDGKEVDSYQLTLAQRTDVLQTFTNPTWLYAGAPVVITDSFILDAPAIYTTAITGPIAKKHFIAGKNVDSAAKIAETWNAIHWNFIDANINHRTFLWDSRQTWKSGRLVDVSASSGELVPHVDQTNQQSLPGVWTGSVILAADGVSVLTSVSCIKVEWEGDGSYVVEASINGAAYEVLTNGLGPNLTFPWTNSTKEINIRITFAGGIVEDDSVVRSLRLVAYEDGLVRGSRVSRTLQLTGKAYPSTVNYEPIDYSDNRGIYFNGGRGLISADTSDAFSAQTITALEFWVRFTEATTSLVGYDDVIDYDLSTDNYTSGPQFVFDMRSAGNTGRPYLSWSGSLASQGYSAIYVNGVLLSTLASFTPTPGQYYQIMFVLTTPVDTAVFLASDYLSANPFLGQFGHFNVFSVAITATDALKIYNSYFGISGASIVDTSAVGVTVPGVEAKIYTYDWSISQGGR